MRLSSIEANEVDDRLIEPMRDSGRRFCPHLHLPLQSGDAGVLRDMRRRYSPDQFLRTVDRIREKIEDPSFTTDVIVGFPTETDAAWENTLEMCRRVGFSRVHIFPYSHRQRTDASRLADLPTSVKKSRHAELQQLATELTSRYCATFVGREVDVLVEESGRGYTERYLRATVPSGRPNELVRARVVAACDGGVECA